MLSIRVRRSVKRGTVPVLEVRNLETHFFTRAGIIRAVNNVSFAVDKRDTLALVGESGCGKSVTALSILGLIPSPPGRVVGGEILLDGSDLLKISPGDLRAIRGKHIAMIFQEPMTSLNPVLRIGYQIIEAILAHENVTGQNAFNRAHELLKLVGIPDANRCMREFPHRLSGGMRQRVMIAMAVACNPAVLIADEPTTALDVTIQAQVLKLLRRLKNELGMALILITHDLGVVAETADRVVVMYAGNKVEEATTTQIFEHSLHPYTRGLLEALPRINQNQNCRSYSLREIPGVVPSLLHMPSGCAFAPRCPRTNEKCRMEIPNLAYRSEGRQVACFDADGS
jgi:oligopeptide/dipeptide ABC transporter ATP-binding protein